MAEAAEWYAERVDGLGERFLLETEAAFGRIDETPLTGSPWTHRRLLAGVRRMFLRSFLARSPTLSSTSSSRDSSSSQLLICADDQGIG